MKRVLTILCAVMIGFIVIDPKDLSVYAQTFDVDGGIILAEIYPVGVEEEDDIPLAVDTLDVLAHAFAMVESTDNPKAYNKTSGATGWLQFKCIMVDEANRIRNITEGTKYIRYYEYNDRWDKDVSTEMFKVVMRYHNPKTDIKKACTIWNYKHTDAYYNAVKRHYHNFLDEI